MSRAPTPLSDIPHNYDIAVLLYQLLLNAEFDTVDASMRDILKAIKYAEANLSGVRLGLKGHNGQTLTYDIQISSNNKQDENEIGQ